MHHVIRRAGVTFCASVLVLAACGDDDTASTDDTTTTSTTTTSPPTGDAGDDGADPSDEPTDEPSAEGTVLGVSVAGGEVTGGGRHAVPHGDTVTIRVTSDVADHVHLHGYDVLVDVGAGESAELTFEATIPGVFEVELEDAGLLLLELEIS